MLTGIAGRLGGEARKGCGLTMALWPWGCRLRCRRTRGRVAGPRPLEHDAQPYQVYQHHMVVKEMGDHGKIPSRRWSNEGILPGFQTAGISRRLEVQDPTAGTANGKRVQRWFQEKKTGWYAVLEDPQMPVTSTVLDQAHNAINRKLFMMKGFHHPKGSQQAFLRGLAHLYNLIPYQRRAQHAGQCGVEVEGGTVPTRDWFLNLQILTSGGFR